MISKQFFMFLILYLQNIEFSFKNLKVLINFPSKTWFDTIFFITSMLKIVSQEKKKLIVMLQITHCIYLGRLSELVQKPCSIDIFIFPYYICVSNCLTSSPCIPTSRSFLSLVYRIAKTTVLCPPGDCTRHGSKYEDFFSHVREYHDKLL